MPEYVPVIGFMESSDKQPLPKLPAKLEGKEAQAKAPPNASGKDGTIDVPAAQPPPELKPAPQKEAPPLPKPRPAGSAAPQSAAPAAQPAAAEKPDAARSLPH